MMQQVVEGVRHLHDHGILHRDLRAGNILVASLDPVHVLVADLGIAHLRAAYARGTVAGTAPQPSKYYSKLYGDAARGPLLWMAPEALTGTGRQVTRPRLGSPAAHAAGKACCAF
jgi:serine/threonine protein kinase